MVIFVIHVAHVATFKAERDAPVSGNTNGPETFSIPFQRVESVAGDIHIAGLLGYVQKGEDFLDGAGSLGIYPASIPFLVKAFQTAMPRIQDHKILYRVTMHVSNILPAV